MLQIPHGYEPRDYQLRLFQYMDGNRDKHERKALLVWPRQVGKDTTCWAYMVKEACTVSGNYFYIFPTAEEAKRALWKKVMEDGNPLLSMLPGWDKPGQPGMPVARISNQEMSIDIKLGNVNSTIQVIGLDRNPNAIRGVTPMGVVLSEFAFSDIEAYRALLPAMRRKGCWHIINSTPNGRNHFYNLYQGAKGSDKWYCSFMQALWPNRPGFIHIHHPQYYADQVKEGMTTWDDIEREYGCSFATGMKGAFYMEQIEKAYQEDRITDIAYSDMYPVDTFWDLGVDDSTAIWFRQRIGNKIFFIDYFEDSGKDLAHYVKVLENKGYDYGVHYLPHDANQRSLQTGSTTANMFDDLLRARHVSGRVDILGRLPVQDGINAVRARFSRYHFDQARCQDGLKKLELYHRRFDKKRGVFIKEPVHDENSHAADALRMEGISEDLRHDPFYKNVHMQADWDYDLWEF